MLRVTAMLFAVLATLAACQSRQAAHRDTSGAQAVPPPSTTAATPPPATQSAADATQTMPEAATPAPMQGTPMQGTMQAQQHAQTSGAARMSGAPGAKSKAPPGGRYRKLSELVRFPDFYPGLGQLWVEPDAFPIGPFRAYDRNGELVSTILMVPLKDLNAHKTREAIQGTPEPVNHIDLFFTEGHPGVNEPHYHVILWYVPEDRAETLQ